MLATALQLVGLIGATTVAFVAGVLPGLFVLSLVAIYVGLAAEREG